MHKITQVIFLIQIQACKNRIGKTVNKQWLYLLRDTEYSFRDPHKSSCPHVRQPIKDLFSLPQQLSHFSKWHKHPLCIPVWKPRGHLWALPVSHSPSPSHWLQYRASTSHICPHLLISPDSTQSWSVLFPPNPLLTQQPERAFKTTRLILSLPIKIPQWLPTILGGKSTFLVLQPALWLLPGSPSLSSRPVSLALSASAALAPNFARPPQLPPCTAFSSFRLQAFPINYLRSVPPPIPKYFSPSRDAVGFLPHNLSLCWLACSWSGFPNRLKAPWGSGTHVSCSLWNTQQALNKYLSSIWRCPDNESSF